MVQAQLAGGGTGHAIDIFIRIEDVTSKILLNYRYAPHL